MFARCCALILFLLALSVQAAPRVVSLAPSITEMLYDLGLQEQLVGVLAGGELPGLDLSGVERVGSLGQLDLEKIIVLAPDLVLNWPGSASVRQLQQLEQLGIRVYSVEVGSMQQLAGQYAALGELLGAQVRGTQLQAQIEQHLQRLQLDYARAQPLRVFYQLWDKPMYSLGGGQIISDALGYCGAHNVLSHLQIPAPQVNLETVLAARPEVVVLARPELARSWQGISGLRLVHLPDSGLERPSLQMLGALEQLCQALADKKQEEQ